MSEGNPHEGVGVSAEARPRRPVSEQHRTGVPHDPPESEFQRRNDRLRGWRQQFSAARTQAFDQRLQLLVAFGLTDDDIARAVPRARARSVRRWRTEGVPTNQATTRWDPVDDLCTLIGYFLADATFDEEQIVCWLRSRQTGLGHRRPLDVLREMGDAGFREVQHAAETELVVAVADDDDQIPIPRSTARSSAPQQS